MPSLFILAKWEGLLLLGGFFGIIGWKLVSGSITLDQLLDGDIQDKSAANGNGTARYVSSGRVQSLIVTVFVALYYLKQVVENPTAFPTLPNGVLEALAGSQALYLGGKAQATFIGRLRDFFR